MYSIALARQAARTIDIQTFIWHDDATGMLLYDAALQAAQRGVRVRMLLDDANVTAAIDPILALLSHFEADRSPKLNTQMGFVIESSTLAQRLSHALDQAYLSVAWRVRRNEGGQLLWSDGSREYDTDPQTSLFERGSVRFMSWMPIDWLL